MSATKRRRVIAGNWKMYKNQMETRGFFTKFKRLVGGVTDCDVIVAPPFTNIATAIKSTKGTEIFVSAQDVFWESEGAYTGEISAGMLVEAGCGAVLIAHSERRQFFHEDDECAGRKVKTALGAGLTPILCVGELLAEREDGQTETVLATQFRGG